MSLTSLQSQRGVKSKHNHKQVPKLESTHMHAPCLRHQKALRRHHTTTMRLPDCGFGLPLVCRPAAFAYGCPACVPTLPMFTHLPAAMVRGLCQLIRRIVFCIMQQNMHSICCKLGCMQQMRMWLQKAPCCSCHTLWS